MKRFACLVAATTSPAFLRHSLALGQATVPQILATPQQEAAINGLVQEWMKPFKIPGFSIAVARQGQFVFQKGFGVANDEGEPVTSDHLFRIASLSKAITSATIFSLVEQGLVELDDLVFGTRGILSFDYGNHFPEEVGKIMLYHLLTHTGGGWANDTKDPTYQHFELNQHDLIERIISTVPLKNAPGEIYAYSNFGYLILGRVVEKLTGKPYKQAVQDILLTPCGITSMQTASGSPAKNEVHYYGQNRGNPYGTNIGRMDSHGGWIATPGDLVRFISRVDGFGVPTDVLSARAIEIMTTPTLANAGYACGWHVNEVPNWWHTGNLPGTTSLMVRTASGLCWAALANSRSQEIDVALDHMMWQIVKAVPEWNT